MLTLVLLLTAAALLTWPGHATERRLLTKTAKRWEIGDRGRLLALVAGGVLALVVAFLVFGPAGPVVALLLAVAGRYFWNTAARNRARITEAEGMAEAMRTMAAELDAGAQPNAAAEAAAADSPPPIAAAVRAVADAVHLGEAPARETPGSPESVVGQLARCWALAQRHGLPIAGVLGAVRRDLDASVQFAKRAQAAMAGPRASALVLAVVPALSIGLGEAIDARPLHIMATTGLGQLVFVVGGCLLAAGIAWTARLTRVTL